MISGVRRCCGRRDSFAEGELVAGWDAHDEVALTPRMRCRRLCDVEAFASAACVQAVNAHDIYVDTGDIARYCWCVGMTERDRCWPGSNECERHWVAHCCIYVPPKRVGEDGEVRGNVVDLQRRSSAKPVVLVMIYGDILRKGRLETDDPTVRILPNDFVRDIQKLRPSRSPKATARCRRRDVSARESTTPADRT